MEKIGIKERNHDILMGDAWTFSTRCSIRAEQVHMACNLLDDITPGVDLKRSGDMIEVGECRPNHWFWLDGENGSWWMMLHRCGNGTVFICVTSYGGIMSRAPKNVELAELPIKQ